MTKRTKNPLTFAPRGQAAIYIDAKGSIKQVVPLTASPIMFCTVQIIREFLSNPAYKPYFDQILKDLTEKINSATLDSRPPGGQAIDS